MEKEYGGDGSPLGVKAEVQRKKCESGSKLRKKVVAGNT